jgi:hypothetical protein
MDGEIADGGGEYTVVSDVVSDVILLVVVFSVTIA